MFLNEIDFGENKYCGPSALAAITGRSTDECAAILSSFTGRTTVKAVEKHHLSSALTHMGYQITEKDIYSGSTLYWVLSLLVTQPDAVYLVFVPRHVVTVEVKNKEVFICDNHTRMPINASGSARLMQKVDFVWGVTLRPKPVLLKRTFEAEEIGNTVRLFLACEYENPNDNSRVSIGSFSVNPKDRELLKLKLIEVL